MLLPRRPGTIAKGLATTGMSVGISDEPTVYFNEARGTETEQKAVGTTASGGRPDDQDALEARAVPPAAASGSDATV